ncbi:hypothetical protein BV25DRAFT_1782681, partial [Artomyces pyxidatus]
MAFPVPSHLPRKGIPQDVSSQILSKVSATDVKSLNAELALSWIEELDDTILQTKTKIHDRIHADLPEFEQQLETSKSVQDRLKTLTTNVDGLSNTTGLIPSLLQSLASHASLAQQAKDTEVISDSLEHLLRCRTEFDALEGLVVDGRLAEAVHASARFEDTLNGAPAALARAEVLVQLMSKFRATKDRVEEQLSDAYARSIVVSPREIIIRPSVQVRQSTTILDLPSVFAALSPPSLANHLTTLRRDITTHYIDYVLTQPTSLAHSFAKDATGMPQQMLSIFPAPPNDEDRANRLANLSTIFDFLDTHLFPALPPAQAPSFKQTLCKPLTKAILQNFLIPLLPSSLQALPSFLRIVRQAVDIEEQYMIAMLGQDARDREVKMWAEGVSSHYERKRRADILDNARQIVVREQEGGRVSVEIEHVDAVPSTNGNNGSPDSAVVPEPEEDAWGLGDEAETAEAEDGWGFDDESPTDPQLPVEPPPEPEPEHSSMETPEPEAMDTDDASDAWGWDDNEDATEVVAERSPVASASPPTSASSADDSAAWDDPWGESNSPPPQPSPAAKPKPATRLEKLANKGKAKASHTPQSSVDSALINRAPPPTPQKFTPPQKVTVTVKGKEKAPDPPLPRETYLVSARARDIADAVDAVLREGAEFASSSHIFSDELGPASTVRGAVLLQTAPSILDLFRALYSVKFERMLHTSAEKSVLFSNDCLWLARRVSKTLQVESTATAKDKLVEVCERLNAVGESCLEETIEQQQASIVSLLAQAEGFTNTADEQRSEDCEYVMTRVLGQVRSLAKQWKVVLSKTKYLTAIGAVVDAALVQMLEDVIGLSDITEVESHRLSELCRTLNALEGLFLEDPDHPSSVVAYVPSWLKFSYLSELLEASLADIAYLFDEGALVDYETQELVHLVRALFADTPQRANMINKLSTGHP